MKVLLLKDVYKLGHAGDVKKVADGYEALAVFAQGVEETASKPGASTGVVRHQGKMAAREGMTDSYAVTFYRRLKGIELPK